VFFGRQKWTQSNKPNYAMNIQHHATVLNL
jgi:hypothetical protein